MLATLTLLLFTLAQAETLLRVPVFVTSDEGPVPVRALNQKLSAAGHPTLSEWVELKEGPLARARVSLLESRIELAGTLVGGAFRDAMRVFEYAPGEQRAPGFETCYVGDPARVSDLAVMLGDYFYSEYLGIWGWRHRGQTVVYDDDTLAYIERNSPPLWRTVPRDDSLLLLTRVTPDGRDLHVSRIKKCD